MICLQRFSRWCKPAMGVLALFLSACAATTSSMPENIEDRAQSRWDALLASDYERAYTYLTPGYRSSQSAVDYQVAFRLRKVGYEAAAYLDHECAAEACTVRMVMDYTLIAPLRGVMEWKGKATIEEKWVRIDGQWWFLPDS